jgi:superfamily II DNA or RNA helicase
MKRLRDYQLEGQQIVIDSLKKGIKRQLVVMATGMGKTTLAAHIVKPFKRTLWVTHTEELLMQSAESVASELDVNPLRPYGIIKQERCEIDEPLVVASIQTLWRRLDRIPANHFDCIVLDEAHLSCASTWVKAVDHFKPKLLVGLTATPHRLDGLSLGNIFEDIVFDRDIKYGIDNGYLVELEGIRIATGINLDKIRTTGGDLNQGDLDRLVNTPERNKLIVDSWLKYSVGESTLAFCVDMKHAMCLAEEFSKRGIAADFVTSDEAVCPNRKERIAKFKSGETKVLCNVMILTAGFDYPPVSTIIAARPTKSLTIFLQQIGRGTRPLAGFNGNTKEERIQAILESKKTKCKILDIADSTTRHQLINTWTLDQNKPDDDKLFITRERKNVLKKARQIKLQHTQEQDEIVKLLSIPPSVKVHRSPKMMEEATQAQKDMIKRLGYDLEGKLYTKRDLSEMYLNAPATDAQVWRLRKEGYNTSNPITRGQADAAFREMEEKARRTPIESRLPISGIM